MFWSPFQCFNTWICSEIITNHDWFWDHLAGHSTSDYAMINNTKLMFMLFAEPGASTKHLHQIVGYIPVTWLMIGLQILSHPNWIPEHGPTCTRQSGASGVTCTLHLLLIMDALLHACFRFIHLLSYEFSVKGEVKGFKGVGQATLRRPVYMYLVIYIIQNYTRCYTGVQFWCDSSSRTGQPVQYYNRSENFTSSATGRRSWSIRHTPTFKRTKSPHCQQWQGGLGYQHFVLPFLKTLNNKPRWRLRYTQEQTRENISLPRTADKPSKRAH